MSEHDELIRRVLGGDAVEALLGEMARIDEATAHITPEYVAEQLCMLLTSMGRVHHWEIQTLTGGEDWVTRVRRKTEVDVDAEWECWHDWARRRYDIIEIRKVAVVAAREEKRREWLIRE